MHILLALLAGREVPSIVVDTDDNALYFTDITRKTVMVLNLTTEVKKTLIRTTSAPVGLAVEHAGRYHSVIVIYWQVLFPKCQ